MAHIGLIVGCTVGGFGLAVVLLLLYYCCRSTAHEFQVGLETEEASAVLVPPVPVSSHYHQVRPVDAVFELDNGAVYISPAPRPGVPLPPPPYNPPSESFNPYAQSEYKAGGK